MGKMGYACLIFLGVLAFLGTVQGQLQLGFYEETCPKAEEIVQDYVKKHIPNAPSLAPQFLRMHFHDCFVRVSIYSLLFLFDTVMLL